MTVDLNRPEKCGYIIYCEPLFPEDETFSYWSRVHEWTSMKLATCYPYKAAADIVLQIVQGEYPEFAENIRVVSLNEAKVMEIMDL